MQTALMLCVRSSRSMAAMSAGSAPRRQSLSRKIGSSPRRFVPCRSTAQRTSRCGHQHLIARGQCIHQRRLPGAGARCGKDHHRLAVWKISCRPARHVVAQFAELRATMVDHRPIDRAQHAIGHVGGAGDLQEVTPGRAVRVCHGRLFSLAGLLAGMARQAKGSWESAQESPRCPVSGFHSDEHRATDRGDNARALEAHDLCSPCLAVIACFQALPAR